MTLEPKKEREKKGREGGKDTEGMEGGREENKKGWERGGEKGRKGKKEGEMEKQAWWVTLGKSFHFLIFPMCKVEDNSSGCED